MNSPVRAGSLGTGDYRIIWDLYDMDGRADAVDSDRLLSDVAFPPLGGVLEGTARYIMRSDTNGRVFLAVGGRQNGGEYVSLTRSGPLSFSMWLSDAGETGSIKALSIKVEHLPEPSSGILTLLSVFGVLIKRRAMTRSPI